MNQKITLLLLAFGLSLFSVAAHAECDPCNADPKPEECPPPPDPEQPPSGSMAEGVIVDDTMSVGANSARLVAAAPADKTVAKPSAATRNDN